MMIRGRDNDHDDNHPHDTQTRTEANQRPQPRVLWGINKASVEGDQQDQHYAGLHMRSQRYAPLRAFSSKLTTIVRSFAFSRLS
jgi:hypothetical protein